MPASTAYSLPPATAPCVPRDAYRAGRSNSRKRCPYATRTIQANTSANLAFIQLHSTLRDFAAAYNDYVLMKDPEPARDPPFAHTSPQPEEPMLYCPVCATRLTERKCKLICEKCGYYLSCADYY